MKKIHLHIYTSKKWILFSLFSFISFALIAQQNKKFAVPKFQQLDLRDGLSNLNISSIVQDDLGYIWISTARGLNRYDGTSFKHYLVGDDEHSLYSNMLNALYKNQDGQLFCWSNGVNLLDTQNDKMYRLESYHGIFVDFIDFDNKTYGISSSSGLCIYDPTINSFKKLTHIKNDLVLNKLHGDSATGIWGKSNDNLFLANYNSRTDQFNRYAIPSVQGTSSGGPMVKIDSILILSGKQFSTFNLKTKKFSPLPNKWRKLNQLRDLEIWFVEKIDNTIWYGTRTQGLFIFDLETNALINLNKTNSDINSNFITCAFKDRDENIWVGSFDHGVNIAFKDCGNVNYDISLNKITDNKFINSITSDTQNNYYIGSRNDGFYIYNAVTKSTRNYNTQNSFLSSNHIRTIFVDTQHKLWVADQKALHITNKQTKQLKEYYIPKANEGMSAFCEFEGKVIACSDEQGFFIFDLDGNLIKQELKLGSNISQIIPLNKEELIVASYFDGIFIYSISSGKFRNIFNESNVKDNMPNQTINIHLDDNNILWIGNYAIGLYRLDLKTNSVKVYTIEDGLPDNDIVGITEDKSGALWLSTSYGLSRFNKNNEFRNYYYNEGLNNLQFHAKSTHIDENGIVYFGGNNGLSYFDPMVMYQLSNKNPPKIILQKLIVQNKEIKVDDEADILSTNLNITSEIKLNHKQNSITIDYHAFDFVAADEIRYCYILDGLEEEWNNVGKRDFASFSNLRPGNYIFKVKAQNNKGIWSEVSSLGITIKPSPFLTIWAFGLYILMLSTIIYITFQLRLRAKLYKNRLEFEHNERIRENEVAEMKMRFFSNISHEIRTPLTLIKGYVDLFSKDLDKKNIKIASFNGLQYSTNRLLNLVNQLLLVRKLENDVLDLKVKRDDIVQLTNRLVQPYLYVASSKEITIELESDFDKLILPMDEDKYEKIMSNLLSNSLKHVKVKGLIKIKIELLEVPEMANYFNDKSNIKDDSYVKISVIDNGTGIPKKDLVHIFDRYAQSKIDRKKPDYSGTGIGLNFTKRLIELHNGAIMVRSKKNIETIFSFILPLNEATYEKDTWTNSESTLKQEIQEKYVKETSTITTNKNKPLILLVEDDLELNRFINSSLKKQFNVISCFNGTEGIKLAQNQFPELIISDIMMPEMDGFEMCKSIREDELISHLPIILLTAKTETESIISGYKYGADDYITKPFDQNILIARIRNLIESRKKLQASYKQGILVENQVEITNQFELNFVKRIESIIASEYQSSKLNVNFLASKMNMSRTNFYRKFMSVTDISPKDFITKYRINKSIEMMKDGNDNFGEISHLCGFGSQSNYSAIFKKEKGVTPLQFKKAM
ncbi:response regulator [Prolixibacteraceae bacterium Z1-6]|uniref:histidine kinase n=1 Tax=Draconibacterium aestuarii TaxID=2998507 RepID=A0A9X3J9E4_9BACT|nr:response regulator [Prolixibacteraceae bacterium Z1-6]